MLHSTIAHLWQIALQQVLLLRAVFAAIMVMMVFVLIGLWALWRWAYTEEARKVLAPVKWSVVAMWAIIQSVLGLLYITRTLNPEYYALRILRELITQNW